MELDPYSNQDPLKHLCLKQVQLLLTNLSEIASTEKKDGENHSFKSTGVYEVFQESDPEAKLHTLTTIINDENGLHRSTDSTITCSRYKGSDRIFSILIECVKYFYLALVSCMSLRSIARRISLRQLSLRSFPSSFTVNLARVKVRIGQMDRHDDLRTKYTCRPRTNFQSTYVIRVDAHELSCKDLAKRLCK